MNEILFIFINVYIHVYFRLHFRLHFRQRFIHVLFSYHNHYLQYLH